MTPLDWREVFTNALWIFGCSIALAVLSYADWRANTNHIRLRDLLFKPKYRVVLGFALILILLGLAATSTSTLTAIIWIILTCVAIIQLIRDWLEFRRSTKSPQH